MSYKPFVSNTANWKHHFVSMLKNNNRKEFYTVSKHTDNHTPQKDIQIVSPTQQSVEMAKENMKRDMDQAHFSDSSTPKKMKTSIKGKTRRKKSQSVNRRQRRKK